MTTSTSKVCPRRKGGKKGTLLTGLSRIENRQRGLLCFFVTRKLLTLIAWNFSYAWYSDWPHQEIFLTKSNVQKSFLPLANATVGYCSSASKSKKNRAQDISNWFRINLHALSKRAILHFFLAQGTTETCAHLDPS